jgi:hypothetical protein
MFGFPFFFSFSSSLFRHLSLKKLPTLFQRVKNQE